MARPPMGKGGYCQPMQNDYCHQEIINLVNPSCHFIFKNMPKKTIRKMGEKTNKPRAGLIKLPNKASQKTGI